MTKDELIAHLLQMALDARERYDAASTPLAKAVCHAQASCYDHARKVAMALEETP